MTAYEELLAFAHENAPELYRKVKLEDYTEENGFHFDEHYGKEAVNKMHHINPDGSIESGEHWTIDQVKEVTGSFAGKIPSDITCWDKYVALNMWYHDLGQNYRKHMGSNYVSALIEDAITWSFQDPDAHPGKLWYYIQMQDAEE